jgi:hypothetical protein
LWKKLTSSVDNYILPNSFPFDPNRPGKCLSLQNPKDYSEIHARALVKHLQRSLRGSVADGERFHWRGSEPSSPSRPPHSKKAIQDAKASNRHLIPGKKKERNRSGTPFHSDPAPHGSDDENHNPVTAPAKVCTFAIELPDRPNETEANQNVVCGIVLRLTELLT